MKIAIIGAGNIGAALTKTLYLKGHDIVIGTRDTTQSNILELLKLGPNITATNVESAVSKSTLLIISVPLDALIDRLNNFRDLGGDENLKHLENLAGAWATLVRAGLGRRCGFKVVS